MHEISAEIEDNLGARFPGHAVVHIDPVNRRHDRYDEVRSEVADVVEHEGAVASFHDLRLLGGRERFTVVFDVVGTSDMSRIDMERLRTKVSDRLHQKFPRARVVIEEEPSYFRSVPPRNSTSGREGYEEGRW